MRAFERRSAADIPSSSGIFTSMMTRSGRSSVASATAASPSLASPTTSKPLSRSVSTMSKRMSDSSSATTTRRGLWVLVSFSVTTKSLRYADLALGRCGGMADAEHSKCFVREGVVFRLSPPAPERYTKIRSYCSDLCRPAENRMALCSYFAHTFLPASCRVPTEASGSLPNRQGSSCLWLVEFVFQPPHAPDTLSSTYLVTQIERAPEANRPDTSSGVQHRYLLHILL